LELGDKVEEGDVVLGCFHRRDDIKPGFVIKNIDDAKMLAEIYANEVS